MYIKHTHLLKTHISRQKSSKAGKTVSVTSSPPHPWVSASFGLCPCQGCAGRDAGSLWASAVGHVRRPRWASPHGPDSAVPGPVPSPWTQRHGPCRPRLRDWSKDTAIARDVTGQQMHRRRHRLRTPGWSEVAGSGPGACGEPLPAEHPGRAETSLFSLGTLTLLETLHPCIPWGFRYQQLSRMRAVGGVTPRHPHVVEHRGRRRGWIRSLGC